ncbi:MAG: GGDEF domain-containing protein, partial [Candidatus Sabulitectum sp.]|nr:GGDEF domain-containing protein [Candidatus Sabulitectum sp.]
LEYVNKSLDIAKKTNDYSDIAHSYLLLGLIYEKKGNYEESLSFLLKSRDIVEKIGEQHNIIYAYYGLSNVYKKLEEYAKAFEYLERGVEISRNIGAKHTEIEGYKSLAEFYEGRSKLESSLKYYKKYWKLKSEISGKKATDEIAHLQVAHQVEKKERMAEIHRLKNVELVKEIQERKEAERHLRESEEKFRRLSIEDPLTGLFNRRYFFDKTERTLERSKKDSNEVFVSIIDIDLFKHVNDKYGHLAGDFVLKELGALINDSIRPSDLLARYGGEEFVLSLSDSSHKQANELMERVRLAIESHDFFFEDETIKITISAGIATLNELEHSGKPLDKLLKIADKRLYQAKESGRNKIVGSE